MRFVTSFGPEGYDLYGKRFLESYVEFNHAPIVVYVEGDAPAFNHQLVAFRDLLKVPGCTKFLKMAQFPAAMGNLLGQDRRNYRYDCFRFSRKCFAQIDASQTDGLLFWIDADVEFHGELIPPKDFAFMAYLGRPEWHSCASFVGWDMRHPVARKFFNIYRDLHLSGTIFTLPEWHDSYVLDWLRDKTEVPAVNLAAGLKLEGPANVFDEVFGYCAHHKKGALKFNAAA